MDDNLKLGAQLFGMAFLTMFLITVIGVTTYVLIANLVGW